MQRRLAVKIDGDAVFLGKGAAEAVGDRDGVFHGRTFEGDEGNHVHGADTGMDALLLRHVDQLYGRVAGRPCALLNGLRRAHEGDHAPVVVAVHVDIEDPYPLNAGDRLDDPVNFFLVPAFAEVGDAFHDFHATPDRASLRGVQGR